MAPLSKLVTVEGGAKFLAIPVTSSNVRCIGWRAGSLFIQFNGGQAGTYANVDREAWLRFLGAKSYGLYLSRVFRADPERYPWRPTAVTATEEIR